MIEKKYLNELDVALLYMHHGLLNVVIDPIEHGALLDDHVLDLLEEVAELEDGFRNFVDFSFPLADLAVIVDHRRQLLVRIPLHQSNT
jgi:hypothetical protein